MWVAQQGVKILSNYFSKKKNKKNSSFLVDFYEHGSFDSFHSHK